MSTKTETGQSDLEWIEPLEAVHLLSSSLGGDRKAKKAIAERLRDGAIESVAWWMAIGADVGALPYFEPAIVAQVDDGEEPPSWSASEIAEIRRLKTRPKISFTEVGDGLAIETWAGPTRDSFLLGHDFWTSSRKEDVDRWNWTTGFFLMSSPAGEWVSSKVGKSFTEKFPMRQFVLGVKFRRTSIESILGATVATAPLVPPSQSVRGAKQSETWPQWVAALACLVHEGTTFRSGNDIVEKVADLLAEEGLPHPTRNTVRAAAMATFAALRRSDPSY